jgi:serine/threonine-protein kinase
MPHVGVHPVRTTLPAGASSDRGPALSEDLLEAVRRRVVVLAVLVAFATIAMLGVAVLVSIHDADPLEIADSVLLLTSALGVGSALLVMMAAARASNDRQLENLGIALALLIAGMSGLNRFGLVHEAALGVGNGWSGVSVLIVLVPVLVPLSPRRALATGVAATLFDAGGYALVASASGESASVTEYLLLFRGNVIAAGAAWMVARVVDDLRVKLHSARMLGSYELLERLGEGGMGEVWRARHGLLARPAAVKLIKMDALGRTGSRSREVTLARFEREAQATALLECPHTIDVYDYGVGSDGTLYYAMELLRGIDLHEFIVQYGRVPPTRAAYLLLQACESLAEAHERGLIHRDIKPANLFLCKYGGVHDFIKVLDFGLVKLVDAGAGPEQNPAPLTGKGVTGTPAFLPPEQGLEGREIDARSDIYALGCVGYWLLTDHFLFEAKSAAEFIVAHVRDVPLPPSERVGVEVPAAFERLIMQAVAKRPEDRPQSVREFADAIRATGLAQRWTQDEARGWWANHGGDRLWHDDRARTDV